MQARSRVKLFSGQREWNARRWLENEGSVPLAGVRRA